MRFITDLHIHSKYSRACSKELTLPNIAAWCEKKGIDVVGTADFTFPAWCESLTKELREVGDGIFAVGESKSTTRFVLTTELSCIYKQGDKVRRIHLCIFLPSLTAVEKLIGLLEARDVNLKSDGRPILGLSAKEITKLVLEADPRGLVVPAHAWTPWFSVFGSKSGFDSLEECFGEETAYIHAVETGLSSDPVMNRRLSALDNVLLMSHSDAHSLRNLGREANVFDVPKFDFGVLHDVLTKRDHARLSTIEFFPEEGKYHYDGHAVCGVRCSPAQTKKHDGICPSCKKSMTVGVQSRVEELADRSEDEARARTNHRSIVPLEIVIGEALGRKPGTKGVSAIYDKLTREVASEFKLLLEVPYSELGRAAPPEVVEAIRRVREGRLMIEPGYDGVFGTVRIFAPNERLAPKQKALL
ncbi:DNA helicase UvrD [Candidatus Uhrbacteria bacterium]|nr:DNA helicase UvrD [Candidatus Uhrbacteria bacterium]